MLTAAIAFAFGLLVGSFLNVCIFRWPRDLSVVAPRSFCPSCEKPVAWYDNVPLLSYALLRGRCRHCRQPISPRYPAVELLTAALFFLAVLWHGPTPAGAKWSVFSALMVGLIFADLEERILPDEMTLGGLAAGVVFAGLVPFREGIAPLFFPAGWSAVRLSIAESVIGAALSGGVMWAVGALYEKVRKREGLGFGDVKMIAMIGAFVGLQGALLTVVLGSIAGSVIGLVYIWIARKDATYELPFGSFLGAAALVVGLLRDRLLLAG